MKVQELLDMLQGQDPDLEVRIAYQPNYPLVGTINGVSNPEDYIAYQCETTEDEEFKMWQEIHDANDRKAVMETYLEDNVLRNASVVWLTMGEAPYEENPYAPRCLWDMS